MKFLIITRLFTGLIDSIESKEWQPKGVPAIYKLIEGLNERDIPVDVLLVCKRSCESKNIKFFKKIKFSNLNVQFYVLPFWENSYIKSQKVNKFINNISHFYNCLKLVIKNKYDLIYSDRANVVFAAFFSFFMRQKVVLRLLGVYPDQKELIKPFRRLRHLLVYLSYLSNYSYIICTQDGSGGDYFLSKIRNKNVPYEMLLNGIDNYKNDKPECDDLRMKFGFKKDRLIILYVGKMEEHKGCRQFVKSLIELSKANEHFYAIMLGDGPLKDTLVQEIRNKGLYDKIKILGRVRHDIVSKYYKLSDIYVSLNTLGNLSNTVLEAINAAKCLVILEKSIEEHIDLYTEKIIPSDCAVRVDRDNIVKSLTASLGELLNDRAKVNAISANVKKLSFGILKGWDERIDYELNLLVKLVEDAK